MDVKNLRKLAILKKKANSFGHVVHIDICSDTLLAAFNSIDLDRPLNGKSDEEIKINERARKNLISKLIRLSSESADYRSSVDFITADSINLIKLTKKNKSISAAGPGFSHEHMVPCEVTFQELSKLQPIKCKARIYDVLNNFGFRALLKANEGEKLDDS